MARDVRIAVTLVGDIETAIEAGQSGPEDAAAGRAG